jgi:protocatechuate 3,4-dioxygenase beta subunit
MFFTFSSFAQTYSIFGTIKDEDNKALSDVTVTLDNWSFERITTTDINGYYIFSDLPEDNSFIVTPSKADYQFGPEMRWISSLNANTEANFTGIKIPGYYSVSGTIRNEAGISLSGIEVTIVCYYNGGRNFLKTTISDDNGYYIISDVPAGCVYYLVTSINPDYYFDSPNTSFENLDSDITLDLICRNKQFYSISGTIKDTNGTPMSDVEVFLTDSTTYRTVTDNNGFYIFLDLPGGEPLKLLRPHHSDYLFDPRSVYIFSLTSNLTYDFVGTKKLPYIQLSGTIKEANGTPISGVKVTLGKSGVFENIVTDINGFYSFQNVSVAYYSIEPLKYGFSFSPSSINIAETNKDKTNLDFIGHKGSFYNISGTIKDTDNKPISDVLVFLNSYWGGGTNDTTITDNNGFYIFFDVFSDAYDYRLKPSHTKYYFTPVERMFNYLFSHITDANFISTALLYVDDPDELPSGYSLEQNYPNPFNPSTKIKYTVKESGFVTINLFDVFGREVRKLVNAVQPSGNYEITFDAKGLTSGVYYYKININEFTATKKMLLMK